MAAAVNNANSFEFVKIDGIPSQEEKDNAASIHDTTQENKHKNQFLKDENLDQDHNDGDTNGAVADITADNSDTFPLEDIPIIILQQPSIPKIKRKKIIHQCKICHKMFQNLQNLKEHSAQCKIIGSPPCKFRTFEDSYFKKHWQSYRDLQKKFKPILTITEVKEIFSPNLDCPNCHKKYKTKNHLYLHMFKCERLRCMHCDFETFKTNELKRHFNTVHLKPEEQTKTCPKCNKVLKNRHSFSTHKWMCGKKPRCECHHCGYKTFNKWNLRTHILAKHVQPKVEKDFSPNIDVPETETVPLSPVSDHSMTKKVCSFCNKTFKHQKALSAHTIHCQIYNCNHCIFHTFRKSQLKKHIYQNHKTKVVFLKNNLDIRIASCQLDIPTSSSTEQMCRICYEIFQNKEALCIHAINCKEYECTLCKYKTYIQADLMNHIQHKHEQNGSLCKNRIECPKCGKKYKNKQVVTRHLIYCDKDFLQCDYCPYKTKRPKTLKKHVDLIHPSTLELEDSVDSPDDEPTAMCDKCGQKLKDHETIMFHNFYCPKKPFLDCNMCSFKTRYGLCLKNHVLRVHCWSILESYECPKCSGKLKTQETFRRHLFSCIPDTVLRCSLCSYMTRDPSCLSDHVIDKHYKNDVLITSETKLIPCPKCGNKVNNPQSWHSHLKYCEKEPHR
ncbi:zinc finger protein 729-like isoform X2 [Phymastichus coffea]|uniref:zinc finger protein 729-like isoform X2 n=1 Tax=Phymastichus coffea TaxID=108790 RepID=UPI00273B1ECD|nr:zinc finger protein 729-like isoform X2 [Phymastichus coffea]